MSRRSKGKPRQRSGELLTLADYIKQYAHSPDVSEREPRGKRVEDSDRMTVDQEPVVDERPAREILSEQDEPGIFCVSSSSKEEIKANGNRREDRQELNPALQTQQVVLPLGTRKLHPTQEEDGRLRLEVTTAGKEALASLRAELARAQKELARTREETLSSLQAEVDKIREDAAREAQIKPPQAEQAQRRSELGAVLDAAESWDALQPELLCTELEVLNCEAQALRTAGEMSHGERRELLDALLTRVDDVKRRLQDAQVLREVQTGPLERIERDATADLRQTVDRLEAALSELSARVSGQQRETPPLGIKLPRARQRRRVWLYLVLAAVAVLAVGAAGVLRPRGAQSAQGAGVSDVRLLVELGTFYQTAGQPEKAVRVLDEAMAAGIDDASLLGQVGQLYQALAKHGKAIHALDQAVKTRPDDSELRLALARSQKSAGQYPQAVAQLEYLLESDPGNWRYHAEAGLSYLGWGDTVQALEHFERVLDVDPNIWQGYAYKGNVYRQLEQYDEAISNYQKAIEINPRHYNTWLFIAQCYAGQGDLEGAVQGYQRAIAIAPEQAKAYFYLGQAYLGEGLFADALEPYQLAVELQPEWAEAHLDLGKAYLNLDDCENAQIHFELVVGVDPENVDAQQGMSACEQG